MISLSVTFLVQIVNFFICWWLLDRLLFRQFTGELFKERSVKQDYQEKCNHEQQLLDLVKEQQHAYSKESQRQCMRQLPPVDNEGLEKIVSSQAFVHLQQCDLATRQAVTTDLVDSLVKRITRG